MFNNERITALEITLENHIDNSIKVAECEVCGCVVVKRDGNLIVEQVSTSIGNYKDERYYCKLHRPKYDRIFGGRYYAEKIEVDAQGEPIGYIRLQQAVNMKVKAVKKTNKRGRPRKNK